MSDKKSLEPKANANGSKTGGSQGNLSSVAELLEKGTPAPGPQSEEAQHYLSKRDASANQLENYRLKQQNPSDAGKSERESRVKLTTSWGQATGERVSMTAGSRGPIVLSDTVLLDELSRFDRERIPERVVHAKGGGAFGTFTVTHDITKYTKAKFLSEVGKETPVLARFSTVGGESGSADTARDPRGFAVKFYTEEGNWDMVGNNTPVFFVRDPILFPSFIHTQKRNPSSHVPDHDAFWDFITLRPEAMHQVMILFSDRGTPVGFRHMNGYGSHTFSLVNKDGKRTYCKVLEKSSYHIETMLLLIRFLSILCFCSSTSKRIKESKTSVANRQWTLLERIQISLSEIFITPLQMVISLRGQCTSK